MKHIKKILVMLVALGLCTTAAACSSPSADTKDDTAQTETAAENSKEEEKPEAEAKTDDTANTPNIGIIVSSMDKAAPVEFVNAVQTALSEQYSDQIGEVHVMDAHGEKAMLFELLSYYRARWDGDNHVILLVNDGETGFSDDILFDALENAEGMNFIVGIDHTIDNAPGSTFVYDASDAAGCASLIMENASK